MRVVLIALACAGCAHVSTWSRTDVTAQLVFASELTVDTMQTPDIMAQCRETNPALGMCGGRTPLPAYFAAVLTTEMVSAALMPERWRQVFEWLLIGAETNVVYNNYAQGFGLSR